MTNIIKREIRKPFAPGYIGHFSKNRLARCWISPTLRLLLHEDIQQIRLQNGCESLFSLSTFLHTNRSNSPIKDLQFM